MHPPVTHYLSKLQRKLATSKQAIKSALFLCAVDTAAIWAIYQAELVTRHDHHCNIGPLFGVPHALDPHAPSASAPSLPRGKYTSQRGYSSCAARSLDSISSTRELCTHPASAATNGRSPAWEFRILADLLRRMAMPPNTLDYAGPRSGVGLDELPGPMPIRHKM